MALVATVLPLYALSAAMARIGAGKTALIGSVGPILTIFLNIGILDEHLSPLQWAGVGVVLTGIWLVGQRKPDGFRNDTIHLAKPRANVRRVS